MEIKRINDEFSVSEQLKPSDLDQLAGNGVKSIICNRPDKEAEDQMAFRELEHRAGDLGMEVHYLPVVHDQIGLRDVQDFEAAYSSTAKPVHGYCRSGNRSTTLWALMRIKQGADSGEVLAKAGEAGFDYSKFHDKFAPVLMQFGESKPGSSPQHAYEVVIVGAGAAGISVAASLLDRKPDLRIALIDPADKHYYQPGFTLIGAGVFSPEKTTRDMQPLIPARASWIKAAVVRFHPGENLVELDNGTRVSYDRLVVCPGLMLDWDAVEGLRETLGKNGVTSNYLRDYASYTWELVQKLKAGRALFTQPPMPIKCAGAPQKALYLSCDHWLSQSVLGNIEVEFYLAGPALFGVKEYVPALQAYIDKYNAGTYFNHNLVKVDGHSKTAWFEQKQEDGGSKRLEVGFDMLHVCPPQRAPDFIRASELADTAGWLDVDQHTLHHKRFANIWALGDVVNCPNAKTAAAVRKQAPVVAANIVDDLEGGPCNYSYSGYGACPLTVERGKVVMAEFAYGGKLEPTLPPWLMDGTKPTRMGWQLKEKVMPKLYWDMMLKGNEMMVKPQRQSFPLKEKTAG